MCVVLAACVTKRGERAAAPVSATAASSFAACAGHAAPPACVVERTAPLSEDDALGLARTVVLAGAPSLVDAHRAVLTAGVQGRGASLSKSYWRDGDVGAAQLKAAREDVVAAAIALAAAAQIADDPFSQKDAKRLIAAAGKVSTSEIAQIAATLWQDASSYDWGADLVRPRGAKAIFRAIIADPPDDPALVSVFAEHAAVLGLAAESRALAAIVVAHPRATTQDRMAAALATDLGVLDRPRDAEEARRSYRVCVEVYGFEAYPSCLDALAMLAATGTPADLADVAATALARGRKADEPAQIRAVSFALASEAFRLSGDIPAALSAAREGLPAMADAQREREAGTERRHVFTERGAEVAPVIALYRAGARDEALASGRLSGYVRYKHAAVAGETPDAQWVLGDGLPGTTEHLLKELTETPDAVQAARLHDGLRCASADPISFDWLERLRAIAAALGLRRTSMTTHLTRAAKAVDASSSGFDALSLAEVWRRALVIAARAGAKDDAAVDAPCAITVAR